VENLSKKWWKYVNLLGLDAPFVAVLWLLLFAKTWRVDYHPGVSFVVIALLAWTLRIVVKILNSAITGNAMSFQVIHRKGLTRAAIISGLLACILIVLYFPLSAYKYLLLGALMLLVYFAVTFFVSSSEGEVPYAKHFMAAFSFSYGTATMAHIHLPAYGIRDLLITREFLCFSVLCLIALSAIDQWSRSDEKASSQTRLMDELTISLPLTLLGAAALVFAVQAESMLMRPFFYAILTGAALLQILNRTKSRFNIEERKGLVSLCLLIPGLVFQSYGLLL